MAKTTIVCWPASQLLMDQQGFDQHAALCNSDKMYRKYGDSAYAVDDGWLKTLSAKLLDKVFSLQESFVGPDVDFDNHIDEELFTV